MAQFDSAARRLAWRVDDLEHDGCRDMVGDFARTRQAAARLAGGEAGEVEPLAAAIDEYLRGKWYEAERLLRQQMRREKKDAEAMLMLATLCRHTGRLEEAERRLDELAALEAARKWEVEIAAERKLLDRHRTDDQQTDSEFHTDHNDVPHGTPDMTRAA